MRIGIWTDKDLLRSLGGPFILTQKVFGRFWKTRVFEAALFSFLRNPSGCHYKDEHLPVINGVMGPYKWAKTNG